MKKIKLYLEELRAPFFTASIIPVILGTVIAYKTTGNMDWKYFFLTLIGGVLLHAGTNVANDYFDHKSKNDELNKEYIRPFTGGSRLIQNGLLTPKEVLIEALVCFALGSLIGIYLTFKCGMFILWLGLIGVISGFFYTAPPLYWVSKGIGELVVGLNFGTLMCLGAYYVQTQSISLIPVISSIPVSLLIALVLYVNEFPDYNADKAVGKNHLVIRLGLKKAVIGYILAIIMVYVSIMFGIFTKSMNVSALISFLTLPLAIKAITTLKQNYANSTKLAPANAITILLHLSIGLLISVSYFI